MGLSFVYPEFLFALVFLAVPVIIHLFNFRRYKRILFTNVRFLKEVTEETTSRSKLKHLLVLFSRLLAVAFLVFAFAQPYIPTGNKAATTNEKAVSIFIDNSFSMEGQGKEGRLLDEARTKAREIALAYQPSDRFQLLTGDFEPAHQRLVNREEFLDILDQIKISSSVRSLSEITSRQREALHNSGSTAMSAFVISDFQASSVDLNACKADSSIAVSFIPVAAESRNNVYLDSCWFDSPLVQLNSPVGLNVLVRNASENPVENIPVKLVINGVQKSLASVSVTPDGKALAKMSFTISQPGWQEATLMLTDHPIIFDDSYYFSFEVTSGQLVLCVNESAENGYLKALFSTANYFMLENVRISNIDYTRLSGSKMVVLNGLHQISSGLSDELNKFVRNGGSLVIFPDSNPDFQSYQHFASSFKMDAYTSLNQTPDKIMPVDPKNDLFSDVFERVPENMDMPLVQKYFETTSSIKTNREVILKLQGGSPLLSRYTFEKGKIYAFAVPLNPDFSGLSRHAIFVPLMFRIALLSSTTGILSYVIGRQNSVNLGNSQTGGEDVFHLLNDASKTDLIPRHRSGPSGTVIDVPVEIKEAGNYKLAFKAKINSILSFNYDRKESSLNTLSAEQLMAGAETNRLFNYMVMSPGTVDITKSLRELNEGIRLWKWCIIFALLFLFVEIMLLKLLK